MSDYQFDPAIDFLFRYRDLVAKTLQEHQTVINEHHACWWGWWKRPTEDARSTVWNALDKGITAKGHVTIGLFDSGEKNELISVRRAVITRVVKPVVHPGDGSVLDVPAIPKEDQKLIPSYYRESPFSRAWMRIVRLEQEPFPFFGEYSYLEPPPLHGIAQADLEWLRGKIVTDHAELRSMDTTIWHVRKREEGDTEGRFLSGARRINTAHSRDVMPLDSNYILHLTDLHFAAGDHRNSHYWRYPSDPPGGKHTLAEAIGAALNGTKIGCVVVTGDLTQIASEDEFKLAIHSIFQLTGSLGLGLDHLVMVPGNHDIAWVKTDQYDPKAPVSEAPASATAAYRAFYRRLMSHDPHDDLSMTRRYVTPEGFSIEFCGLNSSSLTQAAGYYAGMGRVMPAAFQRARNELRWDGRATAALRVVALHHHLTATEDVEDPEEYYKGFGMAIDAKSILREAAKQGVQLVLHGHRHRPFVWRETVYHLPDATQEKYRLGAVNVLGGGSAGSTEVEAKKNYFNLLQVAPSGVVVTMYRAQEGSVFSPMASWKAPVQLGGELTLGEWERTSRSKV